METPETTVSVNSASIAEDSVTPHIELRPLAPDDASVYMDMLRRNSYRMRDVKHKIDLLAEYRNEDGLIQRITDGMSDLNGIWVEGKLAGGIDAIATAKDNTQEVSYWLDKDSTRRGVGSAALKLLVAKKDEQGIHLEANVEANNFSSMKVLDDNHFLERPMKYAGQYRFARRAHTPQK